jgi:Protein of unknown function, DUF488
MKPATHDLRATAIRLKRAYQEADERDGIRVLVDRLWPRGVSKDAAHLDAWIMGPSDETAHMVRPPNGSMEQLSRAVPGRTGHTSTSTAACRT